MDMWVQIISSLGFPIMAAIACGWFIKYQMDQYKQDLKDIRMEHKEEIKDLQEVINQNTLVLQKLCDRLDERKDDAT
jgi:hypothetical protein